MSDASVKNYIDYVQNVLGVKKVFYSGASQDLVSVPEASNEAANAASTPQHKKLIISIHDVDSYSEAEMDLLNKMVAALQLNPTDFVLVSPSQIDQYLGDYHLHFVDDPSTVQSTEQQVYTFSPRRLLKQAGLKKEAWTAMQNLIQKVKAKV